MRGSTSTSALRSFQTTLGHLAAAVLLAGFTGFLAAAAVTFWRGVPEPAYHDESSYLLAADTFARGRLSNPTHPFREHFETFHVLQEPRYASKYPPGQGLLLALGEVVAGHPVAGSWIGGAAMAAAACWMFAAFVPVRWALFGALLMTAQLGTTSYWVQSYWGGCLPAAGGALLFGAVPRLRRRGRTRDAFLLATGLVILANTRPFEGLLAALLAACVLAPWFFRADGGLGRRMTRVGFPVVALAMVAGAAMAHYNRTITGDPWQMPYVLYEATANGLPVFLWQEPGQTPEFRHEIQRRFYEGYLQSLYDRQRTPKGRFRHLIGPLTQTWLFHFGPILGALWLAVPWVSRRHGVRLALVGMGVFLLGAALTSFHHAHYAAPFSALAFLVLTTAARSVTHLVELRWRRFGFPAALVLLLACAIQRLVWTDPVLRIGHARGGTTARPEIESFLEAQEGAHLVLMRYGRTSDIHDEWVRNSAEIDEQKIVWARSMGPERDRDLADYFAQHQVWTVTVGWTRRGEVRFEPGISEPPAAGDASRASGTPGETSSAGVAPMPSRESAGVGSPRPESPSSPGTRPRRVFGVLAPSVVPDCGLRPPRVVRRCSRPPERIWRTHPVEC